MWGFKAEPAAIAEVIRQFVFALVVFGLVNWTETQQAALLSVVSVVLTLFVRQNVTSQATLEEAGVTQQQVAAVADNPRMVLTPTPTSTL
jgi:hypothetical protein